MAVIRIVKKYASCKTLKSHDVGRRSAEVTAILESVGSWIMDEMLAAEPIAAPICSKDNTEVHTHSRVTFAKGSLDHIVDRSPRTRKRRAKQLEKMSRIWVPGTERPAEEAEDTFKAAKTSVRRFKYTSKEKKINRMIMNGLRIFFRKTARDLEAS